MSTNLKIKVPSTLDAHLAKKVANTPEYATANDYILDLIRRDQADAAEEGAFLDNLRKLATAPDSAFTPTTADDIRALANRR